MDNKHLSDWLAENVDSMVQDIIKVVNIKSVSIPDSSPYPYGDGCKKVLDKALEIAGGMGFEVKNHDDYCGTALLKGESDDQLGLFGHLDVVPEGTNWDHDPYDAIVKDGAIFGRGSFDNKGPAIASLYVAKYIKDSNIKLKHSLLVYLGLSEEKGMGDVIYYLQHNPMPKFSIVPDAPFPVCTGEKGILALDIIGSAGSKLLEMRAAEVPNMVPPTAYAVLKVGCEEAKDALKGYTDGTFTIEPVGDDTKISAGGRAGHAAWPELAESALAKLFKALRESGLLDEQGQKSVSFFADILSDYDGAGINCSFKDEYGRLTHVGGMVQIKDGKIVQNINIRYPVTIDQEKMIADIRSKCEDNGFVLDVLANDPPFFIDPSEPAIQVLQDTCNEVLHKSYKPYVMGFTYARRMKNAVAYGPGLPEKDNPAHQPNESVEIEDLCNAIKVYVRAILKLDEML